MTAKLFIDGDERELHYVDMNYNRNFNIFRGHATSRVLGGLIHLRFTPRGDEDFFLNWMFAQRDLEYPRGLYALKDGEVVFYKGDVTGDIFTKYRFADCILINYKETFSNQWGMQTEMILSPAIQYYSPNLELPLLKWWNESYVPPSGQTPYQPIENQEQKIVDFYYTDKDNKRDTKLTYGEKAYLVLESKNMIGEIIDLKLDTKVIDFTYNDKRIKNDLIEDYKIKSDTDKIPVYVISEDNEELE